MLWAVAILLVLTADAFNLLVEHGQWCERGMPSAGKWGSHREDSFFVFHIGMSAVMLAVLISLRPTNDHKKCPTP
jgi:hypothetical protein